MRIASVSFLDLPGVSGDVTVTLTGAGAVSVGTLIIGRIAAMGLTEDTPSVGITAFSRQETDEFGLTVPVERAWADRKSVVEGKSACARVDRGGRRTSQKETATQKETSSGGVH